MKLIDWIRKHWIYHPGDPLYTNSKLTGNKVTWFYIRAPHHLYLGLALMIMSWLSAPYYPTTTLIVGITGLLIFIDDLVEHTLYYKTPLRMFFELFNFWLK